MKHFFLGKAQNTQVQLMRYVVVGGLAACTDLCTFSLLDTVLQFHYFASAFIGYAAGLAVNYFISIVWVFHQKHSRRREVMSVIIIACGGLLWTWLLLWIFIQFFAIPNIPAKALSQIIVLAWNFGMRKWLVFN